MQTGSMQPWPGGCPAPGDDPWPTTRVCKTLWPPQAGTKRWKDRYGAALVCVRYRHDAQGRHRYTTVELLIDHGPVRTPKGGRKLYELQAPFWNEALQRALRGGGAEWDRDAEVWRLSLSTAKALGVAQAIRKRKN